MKAEVHEKDKIRLECFVRAEPSTYVEIPFFLDHVAAGFGNPADYVEYASGHREKQYSRLLA